MGKSKWEKNELRSIEELEKSKWKDLEAYPSYTIEKCHLLRKKPLFELTNEELRLSMSQELGIEFTAPIIFNRLKRDPFLECDFYRGDLLSATIRKIDKDWGESNYLKKEIILWIKDKIEQINDNTDMPERTKREVIEMIRQHQN